MRKKGGMASGALSKKIPTSFIHLILYSGG